MKTPRHPSRSTPPQVKRRRRWRGSTSALVCALGMGVAGLGYLLISSEEADNASSTVASENDRFLTWNPPALPTPPTPQEKSVPVEDPDRKEGADPTRDLTFYLARGEIPTIAQVIERLHQAGIHSGLGAFSPPGTSPPLVGLAVPEGFELPPGYVRHYQATDDGQSIEPILMYSPDYQFVNAANQQITIPKDRVVPPEHAPPGLPIRRVEIPAPTDTK
jgi:hypothetical protein